MRAILLVASLVALTTCERRNPQYCDGGEFRCAHRQRCDIAASSCVDVSGPDCESAASCPGELPLCDAEARVCRPCSAGEDAACAERDARTPRCVAARCVECVPPAPGSREAPECARRKAQGGPTPICEEASSTCRPCRLHRECDSGVCAKDPLSDGYGVSQGSCVPAEQVSVVDPSLCSQSGPVYCTPKQAIARLDPGHRYVVFRKSARAEDFADLEIGRFENQGVDLYLIGPLADGPPAAAATWPRVEIGAPGRRGFIVNRKSRVTLEGFLIHGADVGVQCFGDGPGTDTQVRIQRSLLADNATALSIHDDCLLTLDQVWVGRGPGKGPFAALRGNGLALDLTRADFAIHNTVFSDNGMAPALFGGVRVTAGLGGGRDGTRVSTLVNSTFYGHNAWVTVDIARYTALVCDGAVGNRLVVMNTLFFQDPQMALYERYITPSCGGQVYNVASDDASLSGNMSVVLPRTTPPGFRDAPGRDLHVGRSAGATSLWQQVQRGGAAAVRAGTQEVRAPEVDMDGAPRGQGGRVSIGAYEVEP